MCMNKARDGVPFRATPQEEASYGQKSRCEKGRKEKTYEDIEREAKGEILENKETRKAISQKTVLMFKNKLTTAIPKE